MGDVCCVCSYSGLCSFDLSSTVSEDVSGRVFSSEGCLLILLRPVIDRYREATPSVLTKEDEFRGKLCRTRESVLFIGISGVVFGESNIACKLVTLAFWGVSMIAPNASLSWLPLTGSFCIGFSKFLYIHPWDGDDLLLLLLPVKFLGDPYLAEEIDLCTSGSLETLLTVGLFQTFLILSLLLLLLFGIFLNCCCCWAEGEESVLLPMIAVGLRDTITRPPRGWILVRGATLGECCCQFCALMMLLLLLMLLFSKDAEEGLATDPPSDDWKLLLWGILFL